LQWIAFPALQGHLADSEVAPLLSVAFHVLGHLILDGLLQQLPGSFSQQLLQITLSCILGSLFERNDFSLLHWRILSFGASSEYAGFFSLLSGCAFFYLLSCHPQLSVIALLFFTDGIPWRARKNDLRKIVTHQNEGDKAKIYTLSMAQELKADLIDLKATLRI
jgi:hypothetical protein